MEFGRYSRITIIIETKQQNHATKLKIAIIGLGYVGLPLAIEFSKKFSTIGFDVSEERINQLKKGVDKTSEVNEEELQVSNLTYTLDKQEIAACNIYIITVPTPVDKFKKPDMTPLASASRTVGEILKKDDVVIYESTVYPGATEEFCVPILEKESMLIYNKDFFCGYSPERINPGDRERNLKTITKVTSGSNKETADFVNMLYKSIVPVGTHKAPSIAVAESAKVIENIQRDVNIALINELSVIFNKLNLDTNEVLEAAETKWNFIPFRPGLVGGHCIGVDPYYLTHKAKEIGYHAEMILSGRRINDNMGKFVAENTIAQMTKAGINPDDAHVAVFGLTFKENCSDLRNTKVPDIIEHLKMHNCKIKVFDPVADKKKAKEHLFLNILDLDQASNLDTIILAVAHDEYKSISKEDFNKMLHPNGVLIDVKSVYGKNYFLNTNIRHWRL